MTAHTVRATITVEVAGSGTGSAEDERAKIEAAVTAGLRELPSVAQRYGFRVTATDASVD